MKAAPFQMGQLVICRLNQLTLGALWRIVEVRAEEGFSSGWAVRMEFVSGPDRPVRLNEPWYDASYFEAFKQREDKTIAA